MISNEVKKYKNKSSVDCCICLEKINGDEILTECKHSFHKNCFNRWIKYNNNCPVCRKRFICPIKYLDSFSFLISIVIIFYILKYYGDIFMKLLSIIGFAIDSLFWYLGKIITIILWDLIFISWIIIMIKLLLKVLLIINLNIYNLYKKYFCSQESEN